jgi:hypothetical protein
MMISVDMTLKNVLYLSYLVPAARVRALVPERLPLAIIEGERVFISAVSLTSERVRLNVCPWPRFRYHQLNLRTYVLDPKTGGMAVYFFRSGLTSATTSRLTRLLGLPWEHADLSLDVRRDDPDTVTGYLLEGNWDGPLRIEASTMAKRPESFGPFTDLEHMMAYLINPPAGYYGPSGKTRRFEVSHRSLSPFSADLRDVSLPTMEGLGLLSAGEMAHPHDVLYLPEASFRIHMPPRAA